MDTNQNIVARYLYDPFGNTLTANGPRAHLNKYRFSSKELQSASGLVYYGYRFYEPSLQRWLNRDPLGEFGFEFLRLNAFVAVIHGDRVEVLEGPNIYSFVHNSPNTATDSWGMNTSYWKRKKCCEDAGGTWGRLYQGLGFKSGRDCANTFSIPADVSAGLGLVGFAGRALGTGIGLGLAANWVTAYAFCMEPDCIKNGAPYRGGSEGTIWGTFACPCP